MSNITLYSNKMSRGRIVEWMLEELGEPYEAEWVEFGRDMKHPSYLNINPMGKVPALKHGAAVITETPAILTYLADAFPEKKLIPPHGSEARGSFFRWLFFTAGPLEHATSAEFLGWETPKRTPVDSPGKGFIGYGSLDLVLDTIENQLKQTSYICGEQFTAADVYLASHLAFGINFTKSYQTRPVFDAYIQKTDLRPAKQRVNAGIN
jgi:glutathione S-transferase